MNYEIAIRSTAPFFPAKRLRMPFGNDGIRMRHRRAKADQFDGKHGKVQVNNALFHSRVPGRKVKEYRFWRSLAVLNEHERQSALVRLHRGENLFKTPYLGPVTQGRGDGDDHPSDQEK